MHTHEINEELWNAGIYLSQADRSFAPENLRKAWEEASKKSALHAMQDKMEELKETQVDFTKKLEAMLGAVNEVSRPKDDILKKMRELVVNWLKRGDLVAYGFEKPRRMASIPYELPAQLWHGRIDWFDSSLSSQSLELVQIRVLSKAMIDKVTTAALPNSETLAEPVQPAIGRPTIQPQIKAAYLSVASSEKLDKTMSLKTVAEHVRLQLAQDNPDLQVTENKPSYETIRRVISPLWKEHTKQ
ncbi:hypothetical protein [Thalassovita aquimarina]|uniref:Uncharacterized protein n=1 Tax=Thalassovita aquimarina TaxID=2785917 RepID=A0ABS5HX53_9RHOB|nr:hypothetical protein [Thalassovita aquimarina]MBR9653556.1 hypothetical protein [Thalassovita aquimarina]